MSPEEGTDVRLTAEGGSASVLSSSYVVLVLVVLWLYAVPWDQVVVIHSVTLMVGLFSWKPSVVSSEYFERLGCSLRARSASTN